MKLLDRHTVQRRQRRNCRSGDIRNREGECGFARDAGVRIIRQVCECACLHFDVVACRISDARVVHDCHCLVLDRYVSRIGGQIVDHSDVIGDAFHADMLGGSCLHALAEC
ncbi:hypothetical protein D3C86_1803350 [compost metagenome]